MAIAPQLISVRISTDNPKYPTHFVDVLVDNDLSGNVTTVVEGTYFPYIIEFTGIDSLVGRRFISQWLSEKLTNEYKTNLGRVLFNLRKDYSCVPYYNLDYNTFKNKVAEIRARQVLAIGPNGSELQSELFYVGAEIADFDEINVPPEFLLKWLDFPIKEGDGTPVEQYPIVLPYNWYNVVSIELDALPLSKTADLYTREYVIIVIHGGGAYYVSPTDSYNTELSKHDFANGEYSRAVTFLKIQNASQGVSLEKMIGNALNPNLKTLLPNSGLVSAAQGVLDKLNQLKALDSLPLPKLPKIPFVNFAKIWKARTKMAIKKPVKRIRKSKNFNATFKKPTLPDTSSLSSAAKNLQKVPSLKNLYEQKLAVAQKIDANAHTLINSIPSNITV